MTDTLHGIWGEADMILVWFDKACYVTHYNKKGKEKF